jgi:hypothetical protein
MAQIAMTIPFVVIVSFAAISAYDSKNNVSREGEKISFSGGGQ